LTAYGLGLVRSRRWSTLHELFTGRVRTERGAALRIVDELFLQAWDGGERDVWRRFPDLKDRKTPLSDHLLEVFRSWGATYLGVVPSLALLFDRYELLGSLTYFEANDTAELKAAADTADNKVFAWMPIGRVAWNRETREILVEELQPGPTRAEILHAGFANSDNGLLDLFLRNLFGLARRHTF
jgi:hypothetical protein